MPYICYKLIDPTIAPELVFWVGQCQDVVERYKQHLNAGSPRIASLIERYYLPLLKPIEVCQTRDEAREKESYWIRHYLASGHPLENAMLPSERTEAKRSAKSKGHASKRKVDLDQMREEVRQLYVIEKVPRAAILKRIGRGTVPYYTYIRKWCNAFDEEEDTAT